VTIVRSKKDGSRVDGGERAFRNERSEPNLLVCSQVMNDRNRQQSVRRFIASGIHWRNNKESQQADAGAI